MKALTRLPEFNVAVFAFLLNYPWELLQAPLFDGMATAPHWKSVMICTLATVGDVVIMLVAYWSVAARAGSRSWILAPTGTQLSLFITVGVVITVLIEWLALRGLWLQKWTYSPQMALVPVLGVGLSPVAQWIVLPPVAVWFARRQIGGVHGA